jgi:prophage antirepressor-like protein
MNKISIRFFNDKEVRAVWDEECGKWWFSVVDIVASLGIWIPKFIYFPAIAKAEIHAVMPLQFMLVEMSVIPV